MSTLQTTGFVERRLRLADLDWTVPDFSTLSRRRKTLTANIPYCGSMLRRVLSDTLRAWCR
ncbi:hypothetical protein Ga0609869_001674 [Rhodovulum iodosum]|uniref:Transposase DDE domain-containing protein n=1 Tax=Rhodovulum iodosum TaxID=68291 RepID=A0ABV3XSK3_9RHOB